MKIFVPGISIISLFLLMAYISSCSTSGNSSLLVKVFDNYTGSPVDSALVELKATDGTELKSTVVYTSSKGIATINENYDNGMMYTLSAQKDNLNPFYDPADYFSAKNVMVIDESMHEVDLWLTSNPENFSAYIQFIMPQISIDSVVSMLKNDNYNYKFIPYIEAGNIPLLLELAEDLDTITKYPQNPLSSFIPGPQRRGLIALWFIESSRLCPDSLTLPFSRFPSLYPALKKDGEAVQDETGAFQLMAAKAYKDWWEQYHETPDSLILVNPLQDIDLSW